jgi:acyl-CoA synthetase (AMP-forming)/AMP-acid ligase II
MNKPAAYIDHPAPELAAALAGASSVNDLVDHWAAAQPGRLAICASSALAGSRRISYEALRSESLAIAAGLAEAGVAAGDRVGILADSRAYSESLLVYFALLRLGAVMIPVNARQVDNEILYTLSFASCVGLVAQPEFVDRIEALKPSVPKLRCLVSMSSRARAGWIGWDRLLAANPACEWPRYEHGQPANIIFTSGTTARPKGVMHTHDTALACGAIFSSALSLRNDDVLHHGVPFFTSSGAQLTITAILWVGATMFVEPTFDAAVVLQRMEDEGTTVFLGVPSHYLFMLDELSRTPRKLPTIRVWDYGGSPMPSAAMHELFRLFPRAEHRQQYGMTETGPTGTMLTPDETLRRPDSVGRPMPLCEVKIVDPETGAQLSRGERGEICLRSAGCMIGYMDNPEATAKTLVDGWVRTGDVGWMDDEGFLFYTDRVKDIINRGGLKISSMEIEDALFQHPDVLEAAVVAIPHSRLGEDALAVVVPKPGATLDLAAIKAVCTRRLADYKVPRTFAVLDKLPRNPIGKVLKNELRKTDQLQLQWLE